MKILSTLLRLSCTVLGVAVVGGTAAQSLYDAHTFRPLTADNKAVRVGDVVTIQVVENATAAANADTGTRRHSNASLNGSLSLDWKRPRVASATLGVGTGGDFDGGGQTERAGRLLAQLTVSVNQILPNGDLVVAGVQQLLINDERQRISVRGRVRPQDISESNTVLSSRLADADITYVGDGDLAQRQKPSWWHNFLDLLGF